MLLTKLLAELAFDATPADLNEAVLRHLREGYDRDQPLLVVPVSDPNSGVLEHLARDAARYHSTITVLAAHLTEGKIQPLVVMSNLSEGLAALAALACESDSFVYASQRGGSTPDRRLVLGKTAIYASLTESSLHDSIAKLLNDPGYWLEALPVTMQEVNLAERYEAPIQAEELPLVEAVDALLACARRYQTSDAPDDQKALQEGYDAVLEALADVPEAGALLVELVDNEMLLEATAHVGLDAELVLRQEQLRRAMKAL